MANKNFKRKIKLEFDYGELKKGVELTKNQMQILNAEYKAASSEADAFGKASDKLAVRQDYLKEKIKILNDVLEKNKEKLEQAKADDNGKQMEYYGTQVAKTEAELKSLNADLEKVNIKLAEQQTVLGKTSEDWKKLSDNTTKIGKDLTKKITVPIAAAGAAAFKLGADYEQALGKMEVVFEKNTDKMKEWSNTALETMHLSKATATTIAADFGALFKGMDISLENTTEWSQTLTERVMDLSNFYDTSTEETITALKSIVTGQTEPLRKFGVNMTQATLQEYAFANGIKTKVSEMTEAEKVQLRYNFVMERTSQAVGTTAREANSAGAQMKLFKETAKEIGVTFGEIVVPALLPFLTTANMAMKAIAGLDNGTKKMIVTFGVVVAIIGPILVLIGKVAGAINSVTLLKANLAKQAVGTAKGMSSLNSAFGGTFVKIIAVVGAVTLLIVALNILFGKGKEMESFVNTLGNQSGKISNSLKRSASSVNMTQINGSHAMGLARVPFDGYIAELHEGERVLTKAENERYSKGDTFIINARIDDYYTLEQIIQQFKDKRQRERAGVVYAE